MNRSLTVVVVVLCAIYSLIAGLYPFEFADGSTRFQQGFSWGLVRALGVPFEAVRANDFLPNVAYFLPWGVICYLFLASPRTRFLTLIFLAASVGGIVSLGIELSQVFFTRRPSGFDVLANISGGVIGALLCALSPIDIRRPASRFWAWAEQSRVLCLTVVLLGAVPFLIAVINAPWFDFHNWHPGYPLQFANEATLDRPWLGTIYLAAVYNRALAPEEIARYYQQGVSSEALRRRDSQGLIALYTFTEERGAKVGDISGYRTPLDLTLSPISHFRWLENGNGIEIIKPAILKTEGAAEKLYDALKVSNELTVEVWMTPADTVQNGPARIISFSRDTLTRNFTLGQDGADIDFRLRTPISGPNGTAVNLRTSDRSLAPRRTHVAVTYQDGVESLYVDGNVSPDKLDLKTADIIVAFGTQKHPVAQLAYALVYFFPVSFFLSLVFSRHFKGFIISLLIPVAIAVGFLSTAEIVQAYLFGRALDYSLLGYGIVIGMAGGLIGCLVATRMQPCTEKFL